MTPLPHNKIGEHIACFLLRISPYRLKSILRLFLLGFPDILTQNDEQVPWKLREDVAAVAVFLTTHFPASLFEATSQRLFKSYDLPHFNLFYNSCQGFLHLSTLCTWSNSFMDNLGLNAAPAFFYLGSLTTM